LRKLLVYYFAALAAPLASLAQAPTNLVANPSFEQWRPEAKPTQVQVGQLVADWAEVAPGEIGYIHPNLAYLKPQLNPYGKQTPRTGKGMAVLKAFGNPRGDYGDDHRYYLQTKLTQPLVKGQRYELSFWFSWSENSTVAIDKLGAMLTAQPVVKVADLPQYRLYGEKISSGGNAIDLILGIKLHLIESRHGLVTTPSQWLEVKETFVAQGTEQYLLIGTFGLDRVIKSQNVPKRRFNWWDCYFFIDDVALAEVPVADTLPAQPLVVLTTPDLAQQLDQGADLTLGDVLFAHDQAALRPEAKAPLDTLAKVLAQHPTWQVEIEGHTDHTGDSLYNLRLSAKRAAAVADYLASLGVARPRLHPRGLGASVPLVPNPTPAQRYRNRRVRIRRRR
jgi:outer membrane protein OmpA-like peptidoglycan-associated protein